MAEEARKDVNGKYFGQFHSVDLDSKPDAPMSCWVASEAERGTISSKEGRMYSAVRVHLYDHVDGDVIVHGYGAKYLVWAENKWVGIKNDGDQWYGAFELADICKKKVLQAHGLPENAISLDKVGTTPPSRLEELARGR